MPRPWFLFLALALLPLAATATPPAQTHPLPASPEANRATFQATYDRFLARSKAGKFQSFPEYGMDLGEVLMAVDFDNPGDSDPLERHVPLLKALPAYTRITLLTPAALEAKVKAGVQALGLGRRVNVLISQDGAGPVHGKGVTRWMRDTLLIAREGGRNLVLSSLAHKDFRNLADNDLDYLSRLGVKHPVIRMPIFLRGGNLSVARAGQKLLLVGSDEMDMNQQWFHEAFGLSLPPDAIGSILKAATGVDEFIIVPNSTNLYHLDMFMVPLADGLVGLLAPEDPQNLPRPDREVLARARDLLSRQGFRIVSLPTRAERILTYRSPANSVPFKDRTTGRRRALVPMFPEPPDLASAESLNARVLAAYRSAGIDPIPVDDRFHTRHGNIHCAVVPLH